MQPDSFMKKYYATSSEWDIFEFFAETMQQCNIMHHAIMIFFHIDYSMIKVTESTESFNKEKTQSTKADYAYIW